VEEQALALVQALSIPSHRAEIALLEGARARAAADFRNSVSAEDLRRVAPLALRQRRSEHLEEYGRQHAEERATIEAALDNVTPATPAVDDRPRGRGVRRVEADHE
jgi:magnesium chelatase subunit I